MPTKSDSLQPLELSSNEMASVLAHCQELLHQHLRPLIMQFFNQWIEQLRHLEEGARNNQQQMQLREDARLLQLEKSDALRYFATYLVDNVVKFKQRELNTYNDHGQAELSLVANDSLEQTVAIASISQRANNLYHSELSVIANALALMQPQQAITDENNPFSPLQFCSVLRRIIHRINLGNSSIILGYKVFDAQVMARLSNFYQDLSSYFITKRLVSEQPALVRVRTRDQVVPPRRPRIDEIVSGQNLSDEAYQSKLFDAVSWLQAHLAQYDALPKDALKYEVSEIIAAIANLQSQLGEVSEKVAFQDIPLGDELKSQLAESKQAAIDPNHARMIDIVGLLFEYMLADENLPDSIKTLLSHLHTPYLKVAFIDQDFFEEATHPARRLLNLMTEVGAAWVNEDAATEHDVYNKIRNVVNRIVHDFEQDIRLFAELLQDFGQFAAALKRKHELVERRSREKVKGESKLHDVKARVYEEVQGRIRDKELPSAVLLLLLQPWSDYLAFVLLRFTAQSAQWNQALAFIDDTLWLLEPKTLQADKSHQIDMFKRYLQLMNQGLNTIGYERSKAEQLVKAIVHLHRLVLQNGSIPPAGESLRAKLQTLALAKLGLGEAEVVTQDEKKLMQSLSLMEFGSWFEFSDKGRVKLSWYNIHASKFLFVNQQGKSACTLTGLELARKMIAGEAVLIAGSTKPFFERALEGIYQKLKAGQQK